VKGDIRGSFSGDYSGDVSGHVDLDGNLDAKGTATEGTTTDITTWKGKLSVSGTSLSVQSGELSGAYISGGAFSGTGITAH
jgi:hypothetical protein